jgi:hypothetical protein
MIPTLTDFTEEQLRVMLRALIAQREKLEVHVDNLKSNSVYMEMFKEQIYDYEQEIVDSNLVEVKVAEAIVKLKQERVVLSN